jgi:lactoylglutathione lyase
VRFYEVLGFEEHFRLPSDGDPGYVGLRRGDWEPAIATVQSPQQLIGVEIGSKPRFEMFV